MNRLQRECLAGSLVLHTGLILLLFIGPAFTTGKPKAVEEVTLLTFVPDILVDKPISGGGNPAQAAQAAPPRARNTTPPVQPPAPPPPRKDPPPKRPEPAPVAETPPAPPKRTIEVNLQPVTRPPDRNRAAREKAAAEAAEAARRQAHEEARRAAEARQNQFSSTIGALRTGLSGTTSVSVPGTGGATYASYTSFVDLVYRTAWAPLKPRETGDRSLSVLVRVVIARTGEVVDSAITRRSGNTALDRSVQTVLDRVRTIGRPFPEGARDDQREFQIEFNLESRGNG